jgi:hypothetical protein
MCLKGTFSKTGKGTHFSVHFPTQNSVKQGGALSALLFNFDLDYVIRKVLENQVRLKLNGTHQLLVFDDVVNTRILDDNIDTTKKNTEILIDASKEVGLPITVDARFEARTAFVRSNTGILGWNSVRGMDVCIRLFCVCIFLCASSGLATGLSPVQGVLTECV